MKQSILVRLLQFTRPYLHWLAAALLCALVSVALSLYAPILIGRAVDFITGPGQVDFSGISALLVRLGAAVLAGALFQWLMTLCANRITFSAVRDLRAAVFEKFDRVPLRYLDGHAHGDLVSRMVNDIDQISDGLIQGFTQLFTGVVTILGTFGFMASINLKITIVVVCLTPASLFVASFIARRTFHTFKRQSAVRGELGGFIEELIGSQKVVKAFGYEARAQERFDEINARLYDAGVDAQFYSSATNPCTRFVNNLVYAAVGLTGALGVIGGRMSVGQLSSFLSYANQFTKPFNEISGVAAELQTALASARRVFDVLDEPDETPDPADGAPSGDCAGRVSLEAVSFSYAPGSPLIENLSLRAESGQRIAIVGPTGCGKTTMINLLMRFYDVGAGAIRVDGTDIRRMARARLRGFYGMVLQETWLFSGSVRDNIAYGRPEAALEEIVEAAKSAYAHSFIERLPNGYDTLIGGAGGAVSQGQKQLLCIARIMLTHPPMLILDEATSSIDTRTEIRVQKVFDRMMRGRTSFIVAHRLSTVRGADCILVMREGRIIEQGRHEELLARNGFYTQLYNSQFAPSGDGAE